MHTETLVVLDRLFEEARFLSASLGATSSKSSIKIFMNGGCIGARKEFATMGVRIVGVTVRFDSFLSRYSDAADDLIKQMASHAKRGLSHQCLYCNEEHVGLGKVSFPTDTVGWWAREISQLAQAVGMGGSFTIIDQREHGAPFHVEIEEFGLVRCTISIAHPEGGEKIFMSEAKEIGDAVIGAHTKLFHASLSGDGHSCPDCGRHHGVAPS